MPANKPGYQSEYYRKNKDKVLGYSLKRHYGMSMDEYKERLKAQEGACAICKKTCSSGFNLAVDHCHDTKVIRGLLCQNCNTGLGKFKDNIEYLEKAIQYLKDTNGS